MEFCWLLTTTPVIGLFVNVIAQVMHVQLFSRVGLSILVGFLLGFVIELVLLTYMIMAKANFSGFDIVVCLLTYTCLSFCFWAFLNLNITSIRIRIVRELLSKQEQGLSLEELMWQYSPKEMMRRRIERLAATGQIVKLNGCWRLQSRKLLFFERLFSILNNLIIPISSSTRSN